MDLPARLDLCLSGFLRGVLRSRGVSEVPPSLQLRSTNRATKPAGSLMAIGFGGTAVAWIAFLALGGQPPLARGLARLPLLITGLGVLVMAIAAIYVRGGSSGLTSKASALVLVAIILVTAVLILLSPE